MTDIEIYNLIHSDSDLWKRFEIALWKSCYTIRDANIKIKDPNLINWVANDSSPGSLTSWVQNNRYKIMENDTLQQIGEEISDEEIELIISQFVPGTEFVK